MIETISTVQQQQRRSRTLMKNFKFDVFNRQPSIDNFVRAHGFRPKLKCYTTFARSSAECKAAKLAKGLPAQQIRTPGQTAAACVQHHEIVVVNASVFERFVQGNRHRGRRRIPISIDVRIDLVGAEPEPLSDGIDDSQVGLMRHDKADLFERIFARSATLRLTSSMLLTAILNSSGPFILIASSALRRTSASSWSGSRGCAPTADPNTRLTIVTNCPARHAVRFR